MPAELSTAAPACHAFSDLLSSCSKYRARNVSRALFEEGVDDG